MPLAPKGCDPYLSVIFCRHGTRWQGTIGCHCLLGQSLMHLTGTALEASQVSRGSKARHKTPPGQPQRHSSLHRQTEVHLHLVVSVYCQKAGQSSHLSLCQTLGSMLHWFMPTRPLSGSSDMHQEALNLFQQAPCNPLATDANIYGDLTLVSSMHVVPSYMQRIALRMLCVMASNASDIGH